MTDPAPLRLTVLLSGSGRTLDNLLERIAAGSLAASVEAVVASRADVRGVRIAAAAGIPVTVLPPAGRPVAAWSDEIFAVCRAARADLVVMAGFLHLLRIPADFAGRVINIHPSLLPAGGERSRKLRSIMPMPAATMPSISSRLLTGMPIWNRIRLRISIMISAKPT